MAISKIRYLTVALLSGRFSLLTVWGITMRRVSLRRTISCIVTSCMFFIATTECSAQQLSGTHSNHTHRGIHKAPQHGPISIFNGGRSSRFAQTFLQGRHRPMPTAAANARGYPVRPERLAARQTPNQVPDSGDTQDESAVEASVAENSATPAEETDAPQDFPPPPGYQEVEKEQAPFQEFQQCADSSCDDLGCDAIGGRNCSEGCSTCWKAGGLGCGLLFGRMPGYKQNLSVLTGVHGFKGPMNRGGDASFGFHEGINFVLPCGPCRQFGWQIGLEGVHSNFNGADLPGASFGNTTVGGRDQLFLTTALYRRSQCGIQFGVAWDYLHESWDRDLDLGQLRGHLSWITPWCHEAGFLFSTDTTNDRVNSVTFETTDYYTFFYRYAAPCGGDSRIFAGWTQDSNGLIGADYELPVHRHWAVRSEFSYLIPDEGKNAQGNLRESWNAGISLVWYPGGNARANNCCTTRPLFHVANNGSLFTRSLRAVVSN